MMGLRCLPAVVSLALLGGCEGLLEVEDDSDPVPLAGLGPEACPPGWTGAELPPTLQQGFDEALTTALVSVQHRIEGEAQLRTVGTVTSVRLDDLVLHTSSATGILTSQSTLGFLEELRIYVEPSRVDSKLGSVLVAQNDHIPETATAIILLPTKANLEPFFSEGFQVRTAVVPRSCLETDLLLRLSFRARVRYQDE